MPEYQLYCFAQSGNAYRAALMLNLIGADWKPVYVDFFKGGETRTPKYRAEVNEMGEVPVLVHGGEEAHAVGRDPDLSLRAHRQVQAARARTSGSKRCAGSSSTTRRSTASSGPIGFCKNFAKPAGDPAVMAFLKGRIDGNLAIVDKRLAEPPFMLGERPTIADISLCAYLYYPAEEFGFDIAGHAQEHRRLARSHQGAARLEASLRSDAGPSAAACVTAMPGTDCRAAH